MVFAQEAAVVVKGRDGRTVLLQSRGMDLQVATVAAGEAIAALQAAARAPEAWDVLSETQAVPLLSGRLSVLQSKLAVTYRVAGGLVFFVVTAPTANVFSCVALLNSVVRVVALPSDGRAADLSPERLQRRFNEVYLAVDALLSSGGLLEANAAMGRAVTTLEQLSDKDKDKGKDKAALEGPRTPPSQQQRAGGGRGTRRTIQGVIDQLALLSFSAGAAMQGVQPRPGFQLPDADAAVAPGRGTGPRRAPAPGQDPFAPMQGAGATAATAAALDFGDDDVFGLGGKEKAEVTAAAQPALPPGADPNDPFAASGVDWMSVAGSEKKGAAAAAPTAAAKPDTHPDATGFEDNAFGDAAYTASPAPPAPVIPAAPVLRLAEVWRGRAAGGRLVQAGLSGRVEWVSEAAKAKVHTVHFMVQVPKTSGEHLAAALATSRRHLACCRPGAAAGLLVADGILAKPHPGTLLLCYHLPPAAVQPPLQAQLGCSMQATQDGRRLVMLGLHLAVSPRLAPRAADFAVEISVPALLEQPLRASPAGAVFDAKARVLQWQQSGPVACLDNRGNAAEPFVAAFLVGKDVADEAALLAALSRLSAKLSLRGADRTGTLTGAALAQGVVDLELTPSLCGWRAELTLTL